MRAADKARPCRQRPASAQHWRPGQTRTAAPHNLVSSRGRRGLERLLQEGEGRSQQLPAVLQSQVAAEDGQIAGAGHTV
jgi:hypothetical protein